MRFEKWNPPTFDERNMTCWNWMCQHHENLKLGDRVDIGAFTYINARYGVELGDNVQIGSHSSIYSESTIDGRKGKVILMDGVRVGTHSVILPGITIGKGTIVGACSLVNRSLPEGVTAYGIPARISKGPIREKI
jgi:acetyltransferase-like isoleucine patch superfamily enzyme